MNPRYKEIQDEMAAIDAWIALCKKLGIKPNATTWVSAAIKQDVTVVV